MSTEKHYRISVERWIDASPEEIWRTFGEVEAYTTVHAIAEAEIDFTPSGELKAYFEAGQLGETFVLTEIEPTRRLRFHWKEHPECPVEAVLSQEGSGTQLRFTQNCHQDPRWIHNCLEGWAWILDSTARYLETGEGLAHEDWRRIGEHFVLKEIR